MMEQIRVDRQLRELAFAKFSGSAPDQGMLFINLKPSWIFHTYATTGELPTLRLLDIYGIDPRRVVIEITEESFQEPMEQLRAVVDLYRNEGCLIAIDDVGSGCSNMDRIAQIQPQILENRHSHAEAQREPQRLLRRASFLLNAGRPDWRITAYRRR